MKSAESQTNLILDLLTIVKSLNRKGVYRDMKKKIIIKKLEDDDVISNMFIIKNDGYFLGVVNGKFEREGFGVNTYSNGDIYFGYFSENKRNKHGIYSFNPKIDNYYIMNEYYYGSWNNNNMNERGIYLWLKENKNVKPFTNFDKSDFNAFIGTFCRGKFNKGTLLIKKRNNYFVYHGYFNEKGKKEGNHSFFYSAQKEQLFYGSFQNDIFISGYIAKFTNDGNIIKISKYENGKVIEEKDKNKFGNDILQKVFNFRNIIMTKDYFGDLYKEFYNVINFRDTRMNNLDILNSDKYFEIMNAIIGYNKITIFNDIEMAVNEN